MSEIKEGALPPGYIFHDELEIMPREVKRLLGSGEIVLIDCRLPEEYETARIEPCVLLPMHELLENPEELEDYRGKQMVVYCHHGVRSLRVTVALHQMGFPEVKSLAGGIDLWSQVIDTSVPRY